MFQDRSGRVVKRFCVRIDATWEGNRGTLDEHFEYADGETWNMDTDHWMYLIDETTMLNRTTTSKSGFRVGAVTLSLRER